ncbi:MAG: hypothetical protein ACXQS4_00690, partial [Methermicoccaceae archaeon]
MSLSEPDTVALDRAVFRLLITSFENEIAPTVLKCELDLIYEMLQYQSLPSSTELLNSIGIYYKDENVATRALHVLRKAKEWEKASPEPTEHEKAAVLSEEEMMDAATGSDLDSDEEGSFRKVYRLDEEEEGEPEASEEVSEVEEESPFEEGFSEEGEAGEPGEVPAFEGEIDEAVFEQEVAEAGTEGTSAEEVSAVEEENPFEGEVVEEGLDEAVFEETSAEAETEEAPAEEVSEVEEEKNPFDEGFSEEAEAGEPGEVPAFEGEIDEAVF